MGDRTSATITIGGVLRGNDIAKLVQAIVAEGAGQDYQPADEEEAKEIIREAVAAGTSLHLSANEVNYGNMNLIEDLCKELRLHFIAAWGDGGGYSSGVERFVPEENGGARVIAFPADRDGDPMVPHSRIVQARDGGKLDDLLADMTLCGSASLPALTENQNP